LRHSLLFLHLSPVSHCIPALCSPLSV
jgi:hypothetical protein